FAHLLYLEYVKILYDLLKEFRVISISKSFSPTSEGKIFELITTPDIVLFNNYTKDIGYSKKVLIYQNEMVKWQLPKPFENLKNIEIKFFYTRFEKNFRVYKVEFVGDFTQDEILDIICPITVLGYPFILKEAHNEVLIRDSDVQIVENYIEGEIKREIGIRSRKELL
ncbi:MAG: DNA double-strand break repair nuclease NurA, partial [candidate division WOR-3 bacterium]|nr:DNA double-strand break repair nuclease NurA [candidate division WOR-3 bacterium]